jgi:hypothetical protein
MENKYAPLKNFTDLELESFMEWRRLKQYEPTINTQLTTLKKIQPLLRELALMDVDDDFKAYQNMYAYILGRIEEMIVDLEIDLSYVQDKTKYE